MKHQSYSVLINTIMAVVAFFLFVGVLGAEEISANYERSVIFQISNNEVEKYFKEYGRNEDEVMGNIRKYVENLRSPFSYSVYNGNVYLLFGRAILVFNAEGAVVNVFPVELKNLADPYAMKVDSEGNVLLYDNSNCVSPLVYFYNSSGQLVDAKKANKCLSNICFSLQVIYSGYSGAEIIRGGSGQPKAVSPCFALRNHAITRAIKQKNMHDIDGCYFSKFMTIDVLGNAYCLFKKFLSDDNDTTTYEYLLMKYNSKGEAIAKLAIGTGGPAFRNNILIDVFSQNIYLFRVDAKKIEIEKCFIPNGAEAK